MLAAGERAEMVMEAVTAHKCGRSVVVVALGHYFCELNNRLWRRSMVRGTESSGCDV